MNRLFRQFIAISAILSMVLLGVVHGKIAHHDTNECSICLHQNHTDLHTAVKPAGFEVNPALESAVELNSVTAQQTVFNAAFRSRAPPISI